MAKKEYRKIDQKEEYPVQINLYLTVSQEQNPEQTAIGNAERSAIAIKDSNAVDNPRNSSVAQAKSSAVDNPHNSAVAQDHSNASEQHDPTNSKVAQESKIKRGKKAKFYR